MTNALVSTVYLILFLVVVITAFFAHVRDRHRSVMKHLIRLCLVAIGWQLFETLFFLLPDDRLALWAFDVKLAFVAFSPVLLMLICVQFYREESTKITRRFFLILCIIPAITAVLALTSPFHQLIRVDLSFVRHEPLRVVRNVRGVWFWVHTIYSYLLMIGSGAVVLYEHAKLPREYRRPSFLVVIGIMAALFSNLFVVLDAFSNGIDFTLVGISVALVFTYAGIAVSEQSGLLYQALGNIFNIWPDYIFILNLRGDIIKMNPSADRWLEGIRAGGKIETLGALLKGLGLGGGELSAREGGDEIDFHLTEGGRSVYYSLSRNSISDQAGNAIGAYAIVTNVTRYKLLIERVEQAAGIDPLTGLGNRRSYEQALSLLDAPEFLPLSVILGDVNRLKYVNDNMGHSYGDRLLQAVAEGLRDGCPKDGGPKGSHPGGKRAYRIGGDEFVMLLPGTTGEEAAAIVATVRSCLERAGQSLPFEVSVAFGVATKTREDEVLQERVAEADKSMYRDKQNDRRQRR